jgi:hypothetical protein
MKKLFAAVFAAAFALSTTRRPRAGQEQRGRQEGHEKGDDQEREEGRLLSGARTDWDGELRLPVLFWGLRCSRRPPARKRFF